MRLTSSTRLINGEEVAFYGDFPAKEVIAQFAHYKYNQLDKQDKIALQQAQIPAGILGIQRQLTRLAVHKKTESNSTVIEILFDDMQYFCEKARVSEYVLSKVVDDYVFGDASQFFPTLSDFALRIEAETKELKILITDVKRKSI